MKKLKKDWQVPRSKRPMWLLSFLAEMDDVLWANDDTRSLEQMSSYLDRFSFFMRKNEYSCSIVKREIVDDELRIYGVTGQTVYLILSFETI